MLLSEFALITRRSLVRIQPPLLNHKKWRVERHFSFNFPGFGIGTNDQGVMNATGSVFFALSCFLVQTDSALLGAHVTDTSFLNGKAWFLPLHPG